MIWWKSYENQKVMIVCIAIDSRAPWSIYLFKHIFVFIYVFVSHFRVYIRVCIIGISFNYWGLDFQMIIQQSTEVCSQRIQKHEIIDNINISSSNFRFPHFDTIWNKRVICLFFTVQILRATIGFLPVFS